MSSRQFYVMLAIAVISMKMQKLPCLVSGEIGKDAWLLFVLYALINIIAILIVFFILKRIDVKSVLKFSKNAFFNIFRIVLMFATMVYFLVQSLLVYEHIQGLFANTLFDDLSWSFFSLLLLFAVFFLAHRGIENIALNFELYTWMIITPLILLSIFGVSQTDFTNILPLETIDFSKIISKIRMFICWFGDAFLVLYLAVKAREIKLSKTLLVYSLSMCFMTFLVVVFTGIYGVTAPTAPGLISVISEQSLLDMSIGRIDWFLILLTEMGAVLTCSVYLYFANLATQSIFPSVRPIYLKAINISVVYILDIFILVDLQAKINFFCMLMSDISIIIQAFTLVCLLIVAISQNINKKNVMFKNSHNAKYQLALNSKNARGEAR